MLEEAGYVTSFGDHAFDADGVFAGRDQDRASDLMEAFLDPAVDAVVCTRGGYGCVRLFPYLDLDAIVASRKIFAGFSDITTLHLALDQLGYVSFHNPMLLSFHYEKPDWVRESFLKSLIGENSIVSDAPAGKTVVGGTAEGEIIGGCGCLLTDSLGTEFALDCTNRLVLIEDVNEQSYRVDAILTHLLRAANLNKAAGIIVGEMTGTDEKIDPEEPVWPWRKVVADRLGSLGIPLITDFPFGHNTAMLSIPLGVRARLDADAGTLTLLESPCAD